MRNFANYMYLTENELTHRNETIYFTQVDTFWGRVHSNHYFSILGRPMFFGPISTSQEEFIELPGYNPWFAINPQFNVREIQFPTHAHLLRSNAQYQLSNNEDTWQTRLYASPEGWEYWQWSVGVPYPDNGTPDDLDDDGPFFANGLIAYGDEIGIFVEGQLDIYGEHVAGTVTVGSTGNMKIINDLTYEGFEINYDARFDTIPRNFPHKLGLISERNLLIGDTEANGRGNGNQYRGNQDSANVVITAALLALNETITIEHPNFYGDGYRWCYHPTRTLDERGILHLRGSLAMKRRGYFHTDECGGTGYDNNWIYDFRFDDRPPPYFMYTPDKKGHAIYDIVYREEK
ncbi:hypothetical protein K8I28_10005 [bacterium]|nr:hypothetical protein [bacterium]